MNTYEEAISRFSKTYKRVLKAPLKEPTAVALATASSNGRPAVRMVLLKGYDEDGFVFYTNYNSRKGTHLKSNANAGLCFYWPPLSQQVNIEGSVKPVSPAEADAYWRSRPRVSQIGAWASLQSQKLSSRPVLLKRVKDLIKKFKGNEVPRPPHWSGFRLVPRRIEFWKAQPYRLHERVLYENVSGRWTKTLLYP